MTTIFFFIVIFFRRKSQWTVKFNALTVFNFYIELLYVEKLGVEIHVSVSSTYWMVFTWRDILQWKKYCNSFNFWLVILSSKSKLNKQCYERQLILKVIWAPNVCSQSFFFGYRGSFYAALRECTEYCWGDRRWVRIEICQIREYL